MTNEVPPMPRHCPLGRWLFLLVLAVPASAQESKPAEPPGRKLDKLLDDLKKTDPKEWEARIQALEARIKEHEAKAAAHRAEAEKLKKSAEDEDQRAASLRKEIEKQRELMKLVAPGPGAPPPPTATPAPPPPATPGAAATTSVPPPASVTTPPAPPAAESSRPAPAPAPPKAPMPEAQPAAAALSWADVEPVFDQHCTGCHNRDEKDGGLVLTSFADARQGGGSGEVVRPGDAEGSRLWRLVSHKEKPTMPPDAGRIPAEQVERIRLWIAQGAHENAAAAAAAAGAKLVEPAGNGAAAAGGSADAAPHAAPGPKAGPPLPEAGLAAPRILRRMPAITTLAVSPAAPLLAAPGAGEVLLFEPESLRILGAFPFPAGAAAVLAFSRDGESLLAAGGIPGKGGSAVLFDARSGAVLAAIGKETDTVLAAALSPRGTLTALGGAAKVVRIHRTADGSPGAEIRDHNEWITALDFSPDGNWLASADRQGLVCVAEADTGLNVHQLRGHEGAVHAVRFRPDAKVLATAGADGTVRIFDVEDGRQVRSNRAHDGEVLSLDWRKDDHLLTAGSDGVVKVWKPDGSLLKASAPLGDWIYAARWSSDGARIVAGGWSGTPVVLDAATLQPPAPAGRP